MLFEHASTAAPITLPAHSSLFTGRFPPQHGVRDNGGYFLERQRADAGRDAQGARIRDRRVHRGLRARFEVGHRSGIRHTTSTTSICRSTRSFRWARSSGRGNEVVDHALPWIEQHRGNAFFAWIHLYDAHTPYEPAGAVQRPLSGRSVPGGNLVRRRAGRPRRAVPSRSPALRSHRRSWSSATTARASTITARTATASSSTRA